MSLKLTQGFIDIGVRIGRKLMQSLRGARLKWRITRNGGLRGMVSLSCQITLRGDTMKLVTTAIGFILVGATALSAAPYYVGKNLRNTNHLSLNFADTITKKDTSAKTFMGTSRGNIATLAIEGSYSPIEQANISIDLPFYMANKNAAFSTGTAKAKNWMGNINFDMGWTQELNAPSSQWAYGINAALDTYFPTSSRSAALSVAYANPATDYYRFSPKGTTVQPRVGAYFGNEVVNAKTNVGYGFTYFSKDSKTADQSQDQGRSSITWQTALTWNAMPNLHANLEYNTITLDTASNIKNATTTTRTKGNRFRHSVSPSLSGSYDQFLGSLFVTVPLDKATRDMTTMALGLNAGYQF